MDPKNRPNRLTIIRATEIGRWAFCQRAWWLSLQGYESGNIEAMKAGTVEHEAHAQSVAGGRRDRSIALLLVALGVLLFLLAVVNIL